jgi:truncated hemoglobin YjbI
MTTKKTTKKAVETLKKLPMDPTIHTLSFLDYEPALEYTKVLRPTHGTKLKQTFKKSRIPLDKCLEAIYAKYPFLPRQEGYIHIYPTLFDEFKTECAPNGFHNQIERCCFRIDYHTPGVLEYILDLSRVSFADQAGLLKVLEGIAETFHTKNEEDVIDVRHAQYDLRTIYQLLFTLVDEYESSLTIADLQAMMKVLSSKRFMQWTHGAMYHIDAKVKLMARMIRKLLNVSVEKRMEFLTDDVKQWKKFLEYKYGYISLLLNLIKWTPPLSIPRKWNAMLIKEIMKPPVDKEYVRMLYDSYFNTILRLCRSGEGEWEKHADYYLNYFVSGSLPAPPVAVRSTKIVNVLHNVNPVTMQGIRQWFRLFAAVQSRLFSVAMKKNAVLKLMNRVDSLPFLLEIYRNAKSLHFIFDNPGILDILQTEMTKIAFKRHFIPGTKQVVKDTIIKTIHTNP